MKKLIAIVITCMLLVLGMTMTVGAAEYVYYENDFSDPATLSDFTQYRGEWGIVDGKLMLTGIGDLGMEQFCHILFTKDEGIINLTDYIAEVDLINIQSSAGILVRCDTTKANGDSSNSFYGYVGFVSNNGTKAAFGRADGIGGYAGNMDVSGAVTNPCENLHLKVTVEGKNITYVMTNLDTGAELHTYTVENGEWAMGSFGFRAAIMQSGLLNVGVVGFDNVKITALGEVGDWLAAGKALKDYKPGVTSEVIVPKITEAIEVTVPEVVKVEASKLDATKTEYVFYENDFSDPATIGDFTQYRGDWVIRDGRLYYDATTEGFDATSNFAFILYSGNHDANLLRNYTVEVDVHNSQTASGVITHADLSQADSDTANSFYGYVSFISNDGTKGAVGYCDWEGKWGGNLNVGDALLNPGGDYHIKVEHAADGTFTYTITALGSDEVIWTDTQASVEWGCGSFGFRMRVALDNLISLGNTGYDNLKVTVYGEEAVLLHAGYHPNAEIVGEISIPAVTVAPTETTAAPAETTTAPAETTAVTTAAPAVTTAVTAATGTVPAVTTAAPAETSAVPETTAAPAETTAAPVVTTAASAETTTASETAAAPAVTDTPATTVAPATTQVEGGANVVLIVGIVIAVVAVVGIAAVIFKKKN